MSKIDDYIQNPNLFVKDLNKSVEIHIKNNEILKSAEWKARNDGTKVSGSIFSQCLRKAWFAYFTPPSDGEFSIEARKRMYLGYINEEILLGAMKGDPANMDVTVHHEQNVLPVNITITRDDVLLSSTTDFVLEYPQECLVCEGTGKTGAHPDEPCSQCNPVYSGKQKSIFIPLEVKSTEASDYRPAKKWWEEFSGYDSHRRQILQWMYYAKENGMNVPFGVLFYSRRSNYDCKEFIFLDAEEAPFSPTGDSRIEVYRDWIPEVEKRIGEIVHSIKNKTIPTFPTDVAKWMCDSCSFKPDCWSNK